MLSYVFCKQYGIDLNLNLPRMSEQLLSAVCIRIKTILYLAEAENSTAIKYFTVKYTKKNLRKQGSFCYL